jgi:ketosteroid isomerase-like protein
MALSRDTAAMSQENVEICKRAFELLSRPGLAAGIEAALEYVDPEGVLESAIVGGAEGNAYRGYDGLRAWAADSEAAFDELRTTPEKFRDLDDDRVLMLGHVFARGRESGVVVESQIAFLNTLRGGRIIHAKGFLNWDQALEAAGLRE